MSLAEQAALLSACFDGHEGRVGSKPAIVGARTADPSVLVSMGALPVPGLKLAEPRRLCAPCVLKKDELRNQMLADSTFLGSEDAAMLQLRCDCTHGMSQVGCRGRRRSRWTTLR